MFARTYDGTLAVWKDGRMRALGRRGDGPREVPNLDTFASAVKGDGEVLIPFDRRLVRVAPGGDSILEQTRLPFAPAALYTLRQSVFIVGMGAALLTPVSAAGTREAPLRTGLPVDGRSILYAAASGDSALWVGTTYEYRAVLMGRDGRVLHDVQRRPTWFVSDGYAGPGARPVPRLLGFHEYSPGILLFRFSVADQEWKPRARPGVALHEMDWDETYDTVLQFVDVRTSQLLASVRYDQFLRRIDGSPFFWSLHVGSSGDEHFIVLEPFLRR